MKSLRLTIVKLLQKLILYCVYFLIHLGANMKCIKVFISRILMFLLRTLMFLKKSVLELTIYKLLCIITSALILYIFMLLWNERPEVIPLGVHKNVENMKTKVVINAKNLPIIWWNQGYRLVDETITCSDGIQCDAFGINHKLQPDSVGAYLFYASRLDFKDMPLPRYPDKVIWALSHEESPRNVLELLHLSGLKQFNFSSTFSRYSDVPFPLQYMESLESITSKKYFVSTAKKNEYLNDISPIIFMSSNCYTFTDRENYVRELMKYIPIDSYGTCANNKQWPEDFPEDYLNHLDDPAILNFVARYKFAIAIENGVCEDYITEKFWRPIKLGVVPIYFGSPSIKDWYPNNKSAILIQDYPTPKQMSEYLYELLRNDTLYEDYLEHKTKSLISNEKLINEIKLRPYQTDVLASSLEFECFVCKRLHENLQSPGVNTSIINKSHYNCSKPISALTLQPIISGQLLMFGELFDLDIDFVSGYKMLYDTLKK